MGQSMTIEDHVAVVDKYTCKLKTSGYNQEQAREVIVSGIRGYRNKIKRRKKEGKPFYRPARQTLSARVRKKLMEKQTWYKKTRNEDEDEADLRRRSPNKEKPMGKKGKNEKNKHMLDKIQEERTGQGQQKSLVKSVIFVPQTENSELAKR